jgi:hypothetical protein
MTAEQLQGIDRSLSIQLPPDHKKWALKLPPADEETESWNWTFNDADMLIEANWSLRKEGCYCEPWPANLFCIAENDGNYYFIDLDYPRLGIFYTNHDDGPYFRADSWENCHYARPEAFYNQPR